MDGIYDNNTADDMAMDIDQDDQAPVRTAREKGKMRAVTPAAASDTLPWYTAANYFS